MVWGQWSGASEAVHALAKLTVSTAAAKKWKYMGCRSYAEAKGILTAQLRMRWGTVAALARARLLVSRVRTLTMYAEQLPASMGVHVPGSSDLAEPEAWEGLQWGAPVRPP